MRTIIFLFFILLFASCSTTERDPSSLPKEDVSEGINTDYYGTW